jgi:alpha-tubulin suppressor-like RCC1 family protein
MRSPRRWKTRLSVVTVSASLIAAMVGAPPAQAAPNGAIGLSVGTGGGCALTALGGVQCWGNNAFGELGDGTLIAREAPAVIPSLMSGVTQVSTGYPGSCAVLANGGVQCWGDNTYGELGDGTNTNSSTPVDVIGLESAVTQVSVGQYDACALTDLGGVQCWGYGLDGELGDGSDANSNTPLDVAGLSSGVAQISLGSAFACAVLVSGAAECWGAGGYGQLGDGTATTSNTPVGVSGLSSGVTQISAGGGGACVVLDSGGVQCWGLDDLGELGDGGNSERDAPIDVVGLTSGIVQVTDGIDHACARAKGGTLTCWGDNANGELGSGSAITNSSVPVDVFGLTRVKQVSAGFMSTCALASNRRVKCWGLNTSGQLGDGNTTESYIPIQALGFNVTGTSLTLGQPTIRLRGTETFAVAVQTAGSVPTGKVDLFIDNTFYRTLSLTNGAVTLKARMLLPSGSHTVVAVYHGKGALSSSVSDPMTFLIM